MPADPAAEVLAEQPAVAVTPPLSLDASEWLSLRGMHATGTAAVGSSVEAGAPRGVVPATATDSDDRPVSPPHQAPPPVPSAPPAPASPSAPSAGSHASSSSSGSGSNGAYGLPAAVLPGSWTAPPLGYAVLLRSGSAGSVVGGPDDTGSSPG
ncbi:hypothetical protein GCU56_14335 [Geodermatophilus sabuli]|uniref:Uncharacterized protein n=1 Tax=Geodermatophilus sabuli TaxID=1564158 RepID=A0A7K3W2E1_9ACTN|nr:hypothetical protein [Geodermatophilus sabuli]NEK59046.1 hypothetical protein [Geodermatophilus sabuli]